MTTSYASVRECLRMVLRPEFVVADLVGGLLILSILFVPASLKDFFAVAGATLLTLGISLPISLFHQLHANSKTLKLLDTCSRIGLKGSYTNRVDPDFLRVLDLALIKSASLDVLGIALKSMLNPPNKFCPLAQILDNPAKPLRVIVINPESKAAIQRARIEKSKTTTADIETSLKNHIPNVIRERVKQLRKADQSLNRRIETVTENWPPDLVKEIQQKCKIQIRLYDENPETHIISCEVSLFCEQYLQGRPDEVLREGDCIGGHLRVDEYVPDSADARFYKAHFQSVWERAQDITDDMVSRALGLTDASLEKVLPSRVQDVPFSNRG